jgi:hypothetical protein
MAKETVTLAGLKAKAAAAQKAEALATTSGAEKSKAVGEMYCYAAAYARVDKGFSPEAMIGLYYSPKAIEDWSERTAIQRKSDWKLVLEAGRANAMVGDVSFWNDAAKGVNKYLRACRLVVANPKVSQDEVKASVKDAEVNKTDGDFFELGNNSLAQIQNIEIATEMLPHLVALEDIYKRFRAAGQLATWAEQRKATGGKRKLTASERIAALKAQVSTTLQ